MNAFQSDNETDPLGPAIQSPIMDGDVPRWTVEQTFIVTVRAVTAEVAREVGLLAIATGYIDRQVTTVVREEA